jgi:sialate O-acetylesterase
LGLPGFEEWKQKSVSTARGGPAKPPPPPPGTHFAMCFTDNAILQRAPAQAALYGRVAPLPPAGATVEVTVTPSLGGKSSFPAQMFGDGTWKVLLPPTQAGGSYSATAACAKCANTTATTINNLAFGDIWVCSGQSNMQLSLSTTYDRNATLRAAAEGKYDHIRLFYAADIPVTDDVTGADLYVPIGQATDAMHSSVGGNYEPWYLSSATLNTSGPVPQGLVDGTKGQMPLDSFSAHCFHTFQELSHILDGQNKSTPLGLVEVAWGGTEVQNWVRNETINAACTNLTGGTPNQAAYPKGTGNLWNGMILPLINMTIKGATWFQGENNCGECEARCTVNGTNGKPATDCTDPCETTMRPPPPPIQQTMRSEAFDQSHPLIWLTLSIHLQTRSKSSFCCSHLYLE